MAALGLKLYPTGKPETDELKTQSILANTELIEIYRLRLIDLSWLMKAISAVINKLMGYLRTSWLRLLGA